MSGDLVISGGGSSEVATATLLSHQQHLDHLTDELRACIGRLRTIDARVSPARLRAADAPLSSMRAEQAMADAYDGLNSARSRAESLAEGLKAAATAYGNAEAMEERAARALSSTIAHQLGEWLPLVSTVALPVLLPGALTAAGSFAAVWALTPGSTRSTVIGEWMRANKSVLRDPRFVGLVRLAVSSADDFGEGLMHLPEPLGKLLGDDGLGVLGVSSSAAVVIGVAGAAGALKETPVQTSLVSTRQGAPPPTGLEQRAERIPTAGNQIRIDKYSQAGAPDRFEVYLGGTLDGSVVATGEPWDMTSNLTGVAGGNAGSLVAARQAMALAGVDASTPVTFTGYSQGGLLSAQLAASGDYDTRGLVTFGGPAGAVSVPHNIPYLAVEHADDFVPATGGVWKSSDPLLITRTVYDNQQYQGDAVLPAHELSNYRETARLADASDEQRLTGALGSLEQFSSGATRVSTSYYHAVRIGP